MTQSTSTSRPLFQIPSAHPRSEAQHEPAEATPDAKHTEPDPKAIYTHNKARWPEPPPWRRFLDPGEVDPQSDQARWAELLRIQRSQTQAERRGESFRLGSDLESQKVLQAVNAAIHLRRPLLVRGEPGTGKTSLAYALAHRLRLGPVLHWRITARSRLVDGLYRYDALGLLQDLQRDEFQLRRQAQLQPAADGAPNGEAAVPAERQLADYISLGPVGTAFLPSLLPRVLLIDEIDKADPQLPNELLHLFEEGEFDIPELTRERRHQAQHPQKHQAGKAWTLATADLLPRDPGPAEADPAERPRVEQRIEPRPVEVSRVPVRCCQFPIVVMTSNDERDFSPAFKRRCLRISMPYPDPAQLHTILRSQFNTISDDFWSHQKAKIDEVIDDFKQEGNLDRHDRATDQLLNYIHLFSEDPKFDPSKEALKNIKDILFKRLTSGDET